MSHVYGSEELVLLKYSYAQSHLQIQCNPYQNSNDILHRNRKNNPKFCMKPQNTLNSQNNFEKE